MALKSGRKALSSIRGIRYDSPPAKSVATGIDRITRRRHEHYIARVDEGKWYVANTLFGSDQREDLGFGSSVGAEPSLIPPGNSLTI